MNREEAVSILIPLRDMMRDQHGCPISDAYFALDKAIEALEADVPDTNVGDTISRQAAIDALIEWYGCKPNDIEAFEKIIEALPSAQSTVLNAKGEMRDDA